MSELCFSMRQLEGVTVLTLSGHILCGDTSSELRLNLRSLIDEGRLRIVLDLGGVAAIDSAGLGTLVAAHTTLKKKSGHLKLTALSRQPTRLFDVTGLNSVFEIFASEHEAIASFEKLRERVTEPLDVNAFPSFPEKSSIL